MLVKSDIFLAALVDTEVRLLPNRASRTCSLHLSRVWRKVPPTSNHVTGPDKEIGQLLAITAIVKRHPKLMVRRNGVNNLSTLS